MVQYKLYHRNDILKSENDLIQFTIHREKKEIKKERMAVAIEEEVVTLDLSP